MFLSVKSSWNKSSVKYLLWRAFLWFWSAGGLHLPSALCCTILVHLGVLGVAILFRSWWPSRSARGRTSWPAGSKRVSLFVCNKKNNIFFVLFFLYPRVCVRGCICTASFVNVFSLFSPKLSLSLLPLALVTLVSHMFICLPDYVDRGIVIDMVLCCVYAGCADHGLPLLRHSIYLKSPPATPPKLFFFFIILSCGLILMMRLFEMCNSLIQEGHDCQRHRINHTNMDCGSLVAAYRHADI